MLLVDQKGEFSIPSPLVTPYTGLLTPREHSAGTFISPALDRYYRAHERSMTRFSSIKFDQIDRNLVTEADVQAARWAMLIESHVPVMTSEFLTYFRHDHEMSAFILLQSYEELMHYAMERSYLVEGGFVDIKDLDEELIRTRVGPWGEKESGYTPLQNFTFETLAETATTRYYRGWSQRTNEPVLKGLFGSISKDETRHGQWDLAQAKKKLTGHPNGLDEVDQVFLEFEMPGRTFIERHPEYKAAMRSYAVIGIDDIFAVIGKAAELVGFPHMIKLAGSSQFRDKVTGEYNVDYKQVLQRLFLNRGNHSPA